MKSLAKNAAFNAFYKLLNLLFPLVTSMYVSRILQADGIGKVSFAQTVASYFIVFATMGLPYYGMREVSKVRDNREVLNRLFTELFLFNIVTTIVSSITYGIIIWCIPSMHKELPLYLATGLVICLNAINIDWLYQGREEYVYIVCRNIIIKCISLIAMLLLVKNRSDYVVYAWITSFATGGNYCLNLWNARKYVRFDFRNICVQKHIAPLFIMAVGEMLSTLYGKLDITMLGILKDDVSIGYYTYAFKTEEIILSVCIAITAILLPRLSYLYESGDKKQFLRILDNGLRVLLFLVTPAFVGIEIMASKLVVVLYGQNFAASAAILRILAILIFVKSFGDLLCFQVLVCIGEERKRIPANIGACIVNIILNVALIHSFGGIGAAIASVASEIVCNGYLLNEVKKKICISYPKKAVKQAILSAFVMACGVLGASHIKCSLIASCCIEVFVGIAIYLSMNMILKNEILIIAVSKVCDKIHFVHKGEK